ncbi:MAG: hypothetical protein NC401_03145 [Ruminococcus sp.]|nr:hypothetical protein [Ruminococcus sp.]
MSTETTPVESTSASERVDPPAVDRPSLLTNYTEKWAYNQLGSVQKTLYERLYDSAENLTSTINVIDIGLSESDIYTAYWAFDYDNAQFLELGNGCGYRKYEDGTVLDVSINFGRSSVPQSEFDSTASAVIAEALQRGTDYERLKYIHDWLVNNTTYQNNGKTAYEADGPVVYGAAVCEGYSKAFMYMAQSMGYECVCVAGSAGGGDHMWNMIKVGGNWYHVDVTWDDPVSSRPILRYDYFLISDSSIRRDHVIDNEYFAVPTAPYDYQ